MSFSSWFLKLLYLFHMQAASQAKLEQISSQDMTVRKYQEQQTAALESELERIQSLQQETALQLAYAQAEIDRSNTQYLVGQDIRRCITNNLNR